MTGHQTKVWKKSSEDAVIVGAIMEFHLNNNTSPEKSECCVAAWLPIGEHAHVPSVRQLNGRMTRYFSSLLLSVSFTKV